MKLFLLLTVVFPVIAQVDASVAPQPLLVCSPASGMPLRGGEVKRAVPAGECGQKPARRLYRWSVASLAAGNAADAITSWRKLEANPILAQPGSTFGPGSVAVKAGILGASLWLERWAARRNPRLYSAFAWINFGSAAGLAAVSQHNARLK
ncbi:MAG TPA: hypothetical protein VH639_06490 [Bryobacteraceae bacterium]|jgi:hypothetical protein